MSGIVAMLYREGKIRATNFIYLFWDLIYSLGYFLLFGVGMNRAIGAPATAAGVDYLSFFLPGVIGMAGFIIASNTAWTFFMDRDNGIFYEMLTYPLRRGQLLIGKVLFNVFVAVAQAAVTVAVARWMLGVTLLTSRLPLLLLGVIGGTAGWFFFFAVFALKIRRNDVFNTLTSVFYLLILVSSMFYPLEPLPAWLRVAAYLNPITWQVDFLRFCTLGIGAPGRIAWETALFAAFSLISFGIAVRNLQQQ
jgi:ABC-2 type transport system permease protein